MGTWGAKLYSGDFAADLRDSAKAVARLPFEPDKLLDLLRAVEPEAADDPQDADHTVFWLVVADQFAQRGIDCPRARDRALAIIADGTDLVMMRSLGADEKLLAQRRAVLEVLRAAIAAPVAAAKPRTVLKAPQKLLLEPGEVLAYPVCKGEPINPYAVGKPYAWVKAWQQDGWGAMVVAECGQLFEFLAWYRPLVIWEEVENEPTLTDLQAPRVWHLRNPGTLTARHVAGLQLKPLGRVAVDATKLGQAFPHLLSPLSCAVSDISLANSLDVRPLVLDKFAQVRWGRPPSAPRIEALKDVLADS